MENFETRIHTLNQMIQESQHIVFFGGAGVSTDSGIPDFRSKDGLYNQHDVHFEKYSPEYLLSDECLMYEPAVFYEFYRQKLDVRGIEPNLTHYKLAEMEKAGKLDAVITQNIDGLHQKAGSQTVYEIHGTTERNHCSKCRKKYPASYIFDSKEAVPRCECGGLIRPDVTLYGEMLPDDMLRAQYAVSKADMFIIGGTSLMVYPANTLISYFSGDRLVIINRDPTDKDQFADLVFHEGLAEVFSEIIC